MDDLFSQIAEKIISQQELIIGPVAVQQAQQVKNLKIDWAKREVTVAGSGPTTIDELVAQYKELFGQIAVETCKEAAATYLAKLSAEQLPESLR